MPFRRVGLSGPERALPGRYRVRPSRKREGKQNIAISKPNTPNYFCRARQECPTYFGKVVFTN